MPSNNLYSVVTCSTVHIKNSSGPGEIYSLIKITSLFLKAGKDEDAGVCPRASLMQESASSSSSDASFASVLGNPCPRVAAPPHSAFADSSLPGDDRRGRERERKNNSSWLKQNYSQNSEVGIDAWWRRVSVAAFLSFFSLSGFVYYH